MSKVTVTWRVEGAVGNLLEVLNQVRVGELTTEHAASSHGLPVVVLDGIALGTGEVGPLAAGESNPDIDALGALPYLPLTPAQNGLIEAARRAGYTVAIAGS